MRTEREVLDKLEEIKEIKVKQTRLSYGGTKVKRINAITDALDWVLGKLDLPL